MTMSINPQTKQLSGDWTISGVVRQMRDLSDILEKFASEPIKDMPVDCGGIDSIDMSGLQLLHVWIQCARMHGVQAHLINLSPHMRQTIQRLGLKHCFSDDYPEA